MRLISLAISADVLDRLKQHHRDIDSRRSQRAGTPGAAAGNTRDIPMPPHRAS